MILYNLTPAQQIKLREAVPLDRSKGFGDFADIIGALCNNNGGFFALSTPITAGVTLAQVAMNDNTLFTVPSGVAAITTNSTGAGTIFVSDGTHWQQYATSGATLAGVQTLSSKTLTQPIMNGEVDGVLGSLNLSAADVMLNATQAANKILIVTTGGAYSIIAPATLGQIYKVINSDASNPAKIKVTGQTGITIPAGQTVDVECNGTDYVNASSTTLPALNLGGNKQPNTFMVENVLPGALPATAANHGPFFIAPIACQVTAVSEAHTALGTDGSAVTLDIEKLTGTQAPGGGVACLGATKINLKGAINTVQSPALTGTTANLQLAAGDRLSLLLAGAPTAVAGVCVQISLKAI